jgi:hypothetical protein
MPDVSIIIQGRLHRNSLDAIAGFREHGQVILDCPETDDMSILEDYDLTDVKRVTHSSEIPSTTFNICSGYYHCSSALAGLRIAETEFAVKVRSDLFIGNIYPLIHKLRQNPDKYVCSHLYFRPDAVAKFHPSDQIVGMKTLVFIKAMEIACFRLANHSKQLRQCYNDHRQTSNELYVYPLPDDVIGSAVPDADLGLERGQGLTPEVLFGTSYLAAKGIQQIPSNSRSIMLDHFDVVCLEDMFPYRDRYGNVNQIEPSGNPVIRRMEDL